MKLPRPSSDHQRRALKIATARFVGQCGGQESAASVTRVGHQALSDYGNTTSDRHRDTFMALDVVLDLALDRLAAGETPSLLVDLCRLAGGAFVPLPRKGADGAWAQEVADAVREGGEAASAVCQALADDGAVSAEEIRERRIIEEISEAIEALATLRAHCESVAAEEARS